MKKLVFVLIMSLSVVALSACGKNNTADKSEGKSADQSADQEEVNEKQDDKKEKEKTSEDEVSYSPEEAKVSAPTNDELVEAYVKQLQDIADSMEYADELAFTIADVNGDEIKELLYSESSVNAAGVNVCFYDNGVIKTIGPFGSYGGIKYAPQDSQIISMMDNMDYMRYELVNIGPDYDIKSFDTFAIEPDVQTGDYLYYVNDAEVTYDQYAQAFYYLKSLDVRSIDYYDLYLYGWCNDEYDPIKKRVETILTDEEAGRKYNMNIPMDEKKKLIGTWNIYSSEVEGEVLYKGEDEIEGKVIVHDDYTVDIYRFDDEIWYKDMQMRFVNGVMNDHADNTDWYVELDADNMGSDTFNVNVTADDMLCLSYTNEYDFEYPVAAWKMYSRE